MGKLWRSKMHVYLQVQRLKHHFYAKSTQDIFRLIYQHNIWGNPETRSGWGSTIAGANGTERIRKTLPQLIKQFEITSILDAPCGDFNWMRLVDLAGIAYTGIDIVPEVIEYNRERYETAARQFFVADITRDALPSTDLAIVRDVLIHLTNEQVAAAIKNICNSGVRYLLISNYASVPRNGNTFVGGLRLYDLYKEPFATKLKLPAPIRVFRDGDGSMGRQMILIDNINRD